MDEEFLQRLRSTFRIEATEHLQAIESGLITLESADTPAARQAQLELVFRAAHSLKGAARAVNFTGVESQSQRLEEQFAQWRRESPSEAAFDRAHQLLDSITNLLSEELSPPGPSTEPAVDAVAEGPPDQQTASTRESAQIPANEPVPAAWNAQAVGENVRVSLGKLDRQLLDVEELLAPVQATRQRLTQIQALVADCEVWRKALTAIQPASLVLAQKQQRPQVADTEYAGTAWSTLPGFVEEEMSRFASFQRKLTELNRDAEQDAQDLSRRVDDLLADSREMRLQPFASVAAAFPKIVRDLARDLRKDAVLVTTGTQVEMDRRILEDMKDPLVHLLRNCLDHGIESPEQRSRLGKPPCATVRLDVTPIEGNQVEIVIADDGKGVDPEHVRHAAVERGLLSAEAASALDESALHELIFQSQLSTSELITNVSGRGLGLAIVREKAERLGGRVSVESQPGQGARFRIVLPSALATFRGVLVSVADQIFVCPSAQVDRVTRVEQATVRGVEGRDTVVVDGRTLALCPLSGILGLPSEAPLATLPVVVLGTADQRIAFAVDAVLEEVAVLTRPLRSPLLHVRHVSGATVLTGGKLALILNVAELFETASHWEGRLAPGTRKKSQSKKRAILVAEDSITSRLLFQNLLESGGYRVVTAVDGVDAYTKLRGEGFDLLVSDVEMPRLNGFGLTQRIRADRALAELPVVLVTALESREDQEKGMDVGANAYLGKSTLDRNTLLGTVRRLIRTG